MILGRMNKWICLFWWKRQEVCNGKSSGSDNLLFCENHLKKRQIRRMDSFEPLLLPFSSRKWVYWATSYHILIRKPVADSFWFLIKRTWTIHSVIRLKHIWLVYFPTFHNTQSTDFINHIYKYNSILCWE